MRQEQFTGQSGAQSTGPVEEAVRRYKQLQDRGDKRRADRVFDEICQALEKVVAKLSRPHLDAHPEITADELKAAAHLAIFKGMERYQPGGAALFTTFAYDTIRGSLKNYVRDNYGGIIHDPRYLYEIRPRLRDAADALTASGQEVTTEALATATGIEPDRITKALQTEATTQSTLRISDDGERGCIGPERLPTLEDAALGDWIPGVHTRLALEKPLAHLPEELRAVIGYRFQLQMTLQETADVLGIPRETVRQREQKALARLRAVIEFGDPLDSESPALRRLLTRENISRQPEPHRSVLLDYYHEALTLSQIARKLDMDTSEVENLRRRALETLQKQCQQQEKPTQATGGE